jgi:thioredoxin reductase
MFDLIIIGGGTTGMTTEVYTTRKNKYLVFDQRHRWPGNSTSREINYTGYHLL